MAEEKKFDVKSIATTVKGTVTDKKFLGGALTGAGLTLIGTCIAKAVGKKNSSKKKRRSKRERDLRHKAHLKRLEKISRGYPSPVYYTDEIYVRGRGYIENQKPYYKRLYRGKRSKHLKKQSHKKIRRYNGELHNGWQCHKLYDFWWEYC